MFDRNDGGRLLSRFVEVMLPGMCILAPILLIGISATHEGDARRAWEQIHAFLRNVSAEWGLALCLAIAAFLIGVVTRAIKVNAADRICRRLFGWMARGEFAQKLHEKEFPYLPVLGSLLTDIRRNGRAEDVKAPVEGTGNSMYNLWKLELIEKKPQTFLVVLEFEGRVRLFASLFWAGLVGVLVTFSGILAFGFSQRSLAAFQPILLGQLTISFLVMCVFGWRLRLARGQEVIHLFFAYVLLAEEQAAATRTPAGSVLEGQESTGPSDIELPTLNGSHSPPNPV